MKFKVVRRWNDVRPSSSWIGILRRDNWDDFHYKTTFDLRLISPEGTIYDIGTTKVSQIGLKTGIQIVDHPIPTQFDALDVSFFSLGQSDDYYVQLNALGAEIREEVLESIRDVAFDLTILTNVENSESFRQSLMRSLHINTVRTQFYRLAHGGERHEAFTFAYTYPTKPTKIDFVVRPGSIPPTNVHVLIGRNAVGKTTLLSRLEYLVRNPDTPQDSVESFGFVHSQDGTDAFWNVGTVAFSAFDTFGENSEEVSSQNSPKYQYFGLKKPIRVDSATVTPLGPDQGQVSDQESEEMQDGFDDSYVHKSRGDIVAEFASLLRNVVRYKQKQFSKAIEILSSDPLIASSLLYQRFNGDAELLPEPSTEAIIDEFRLMSSGHKIVVFTIAGLVSCVDEKTLILIDEPETHLHPPLLSAFVRAVSDLLIDRNGVAIIATHSPVVLQEVPKSCVWILSRFGRDVKPERPAIETFGENVGTLTREVFGLEVTRAGFYQMLTRLVESSESYDEVLQRLGEQLGSEGQAMVRVLMSEKQ